VQCAKSRQVVNKSAAGLDGVVNILYSWVCAPNWRYFLGSVPVALTILVVSSSTSSAAQVHLKLHEFDAELAKGNAVDPHQTPPDALWQGERRVRLSAKASKPSSSLSTRVKSWWCTIRAKTCCPIRSRTAPRQGLRELMMHSTKLFTSHKVMAKCASRYEAAENRPHPTASPVISFSLFSYADNGI
jgi:hypothetical protein